ncbi:hypothetical protein [Bacillus mycoides]|uniref:hypothetical protein n=1 Tax=Bacillus mycoides TaxID=1405 RepID=UPI001C020188|nr:hypothetical protein [Bacillus mycoides]
MEKVMEREMILEFEELEEIVAPGAAQEFLTGFGTGLAVVGGSLSIVGAVVAAT